MQIVRAITIAKTFTATARRVAQIVQLMILQHDAGTLRNQPAKRFFASRVELGTLFMHIGQGVNHRCAAQADKVRPVSAMPHPAAMPTPNRYARKHETPRRNEPAHE